MSTSPFEESIYLQKSIQAPSICSWGDLATQHLFMLTGMFLVKITSIFCSKIVNSVGFQWFVLHLQFYQNDETGLYAEIECHYKVCYTYIVITMCTWLDGFSSLLRLLCPRGVLGENTIFWPRYVPADLLLILRRDSFLWLDNVECRLRRTAQSVQIILESMRWGLQPKFSKATLTVSSFLRSLESTETRSYRFLFTEYVNWESHMQHLSPDIVNVWNETPH